MKYISDDELLEYRDGLLTAEEGIETALRVMSQIELGDGTDRLWEDLNRALADVQTGLHKEHLMRAP